MKKVIITLMALFSVNAFAGNTNVVNSDLVYKAYKAGVSTDVIIKAVAAGKVTNQMTPEQIVEALR